MGLLFYPNGKIDECLVDMAEMVTISFFPIRLLFFHQYYFFSESVFVK